MSLEVQEDRYLPVQDGGIRSIVQDPIASDSSAIFFVVEFDWHLFESVLDHVGGCLEDELVRNRWLLFRNIQIGDVGFCAVPVDWAQPQVVRLRRLAIEKTSPSCEFAFIGLVTFDQAAFA